MLECLFPGSHIFLILGVFPCFGEPHPPIAYRFWFCFVLFFEACLPENENEFIFYFHFLIDNLGGDDKILGWKSF